MTPSHPNTGDPQTNTPCNYGSIGVLETRPDSIQCHLCGSWWASLAAHAQNTHDLSADEYRARFGLMKKTKLVAPVLRKAQSERAADHLRKIGGPHRETVKNLSFEERRQRALKAERREEHELNSPPPERADPMLEARFGPAKRVPDVVLREAVTVFVEELSERSRGVWVRTGERLGVEMLGEVVVRSEKDRGHSAGCATRGGAMGVRLNRTAVVERGKADEAMQFAADVTSYIKENWGIPIMWGMEVGGTFGKVHWFADYTDMAQLEETLGRSMTDEGYRKLLDDSADLFIVGETTDTLVYTM